jgi:hypothetical protein
MPFLSERKSEANILTDVLNSFWFEGFVVGFGVGLLAGVLIRRKN